MNYLKKTPEFTPLYRTKKISPEETESYETNVFINIPLYEEFRANMETIHATRTPEKATMYDAYRIEPAAGEAEKAVDNTHCSIQLPNKPLWVKKGNNVENPETKETWKNPTPVDAGWNYKQVCWNEVPISGRNPVPVIYATSLLDSLEKELDIFQSERPLAPPKPAYCWLTQHPHEGIMEEDDDMPQLPVQIKNANMDDILDKHALENPPQCKREWTKVIVENFDWVDTRLEWLSASVEEADDDAKNEETFE